MNELFEPIKEADTPDEMRAEFERLSRHDSMVRQVFDMASFHGMSGEDKYVVLAYHVMRLLQTYQRNVLDYVMTHPTPPMIIHTRNDF